MPAAIRRKMGLRSGSRVVFLESGEEARLLKEEDLEQAFDAFDRMRRESGLTRKRMNAFVTEAKARLWKEHCPNRRSSSQDP